MTQDRHLTGSTGAAFATQVDPVVKVQPFKGEPSAQFKHVPGANPYESGLDQLRDQPKTVPLTGGNN